MLIHFLKSISCAFGDIFAKCDFCYRSQKIELLEIKSFWKSKGTSTKKCFIRMVSSEHLYCRWASYFGRWFLVNLVCTINHQPWWQHRVIEPLAISIIKWSKQMGWIIPWNTNWNQFHVIMKSHSKTVTLNV